MAGEHFFDGFLLNLRKDAGKAKLADLVARMNRGEALTPGDVERELAALEVIAE